MDKLIKLKNKRLKVLSPINQIPGSPTKPDTPKRKQIKRMIERKKTSEKLESPLIRAIERKIVEKHDSDSECDDNIDLFIFK
tara:strand:- start:348 stop:593 length:246 start_codon:yes stop_codon:yes gene_type:complete